MHINDREIKCREKNPWHSYNFLKRAKEALRVGKMNRSKRLTLTSPERKLTLKHIRMHKTALSS